MWKSNNILSVNAKMLKIAGLFRSFLITKFMVKDTFQCNIYRLTSVIFLYTADQKTAQTFLTTAVDLYGTLSAGVTPSVPSKNIYFGGLFPRELLQHVLQHEQIPKLQKMEQHVKQLSLENRSLERSSRHKCDGRGNI